MRLDRFVLPLVATVFITSCTTAVEEKKPMDMDQVKTEIQAMEDAYAAGEKAKDAKAVAAYYSEDAISYSRNEEPTKGRAAITDSIARRIERDTTGRTSVYKVVDIFGQGDTVTEIGSWANSDKDGKEIAHGHYMSVFQKKDGKYQCIRDMSVSSMPEKNNLNGVEELISYQL